MPSINLKHRAAVHHATAASFSLHRMRMESYADAISALIECFEQVSAELHQLRQQLQEICNAIGSTEYMDPPDGGSVTISEQVSRMRENRDQLRQQVTLLNTLVAEAKQAFDGVEVNSRWFDRGVAILDEALPKEPKL